MTNPTHQVYDPLAVTLRDIPREIRFGRPLVTPPQGGKRVAYTRATTIADTLDDRYNLEKWKMRQVALGLADRPDLLLGVAAHRDNKKRLDGYCDDAVEAAKGGAAATTGTAVHKLAELVDQNLPLPPLPDSALADLNAYEQTTRRHDLSVLLIEQFTVIDDLQVGGTPDRVVTYQGRNYIADLKTGSITYSAGSIAAQLALYSRGVAYHHAPDPADDRRQPLPDVDQDWAIIIHLPAGTGRCELVWVNIAAGWEAVQHSMWARAWRKRRDLTHPFTHADTPTAGRSVAEQIHAARSRDALEAIWRAHADQWTDQHTQAASARLNALNAQLRLAT